MNIAHEIDLLIRARYPLINIISCEEERVLSTIKDIVKDRKALFSWTMGEGLEIICSKGIYPDLEAQDPLMVLDRIEKFAGEAIFVLRDFHLFWKDNRVLVKLKSLCSCLKKSTKNIILITPSSIIPPELKDHITVINFPLPDYNEMERIFEQTALSKI